MDGLPWGEIAYGGCEWLVLGCWNLGREGPGSQTTKLQGVGATCSREGKMGFWNISDAVTGTYDRSGGAEGGG